MFARIDELDSNLRGQVSRRKDIKVKDDYSATIVERATVSQSVSVIPTAAYNTCTCTGTTTAMKESTVGGKKRRGGRSLRNTGHLHCTCISTDIFPI